MRAVNGRTDSKEFRRAMQTGRDIQDAAQVGRSGAQVSVRVGGEAC